MIRNNRLFLRLLNTLLWFFLLFSSSAISGKAPPKIPEPLKPWVDWVLYDHQEKMQCIPRYNNPDILQCNWPTALRMNLTNTGGIFSQSWQIYHETIISLPGNQHQWPGNVTVDGKPAIVMDINNIPKIRLKPGNYMVTGTFHWRRMPEYLQIPPETALVSLTVGQKNIRFPSIDESGRLWVKGQETEEKIENRLQLKIYRLVREGIPSTITIYGDLDIAGSNREITLGPAYSSDNIIPLSLTSSLPVKLEQDGKIRVQVRPGRFFLTLTIRRIGPLRSLSFQHPDDGFWPREEIWAYAADSRLRTVEIEGVPSIDPQQTTVPEDWKNYPAYRLLPGETMRFKEIKRGDPEPAPDQLQIDRNLWLRFDGSGYAIRDVITGKKNTRWRLEMDSSIILGRVSVDGKEQLITQRKGMDKTGIELRKGLLDLTADSIYAGNISSLPATGWDHDFQKAKGKLNLPPGWKLLHAGGMENISRTWIKQWTLLDFFLVLIFTIAAAKLFSKPLAAIAFITLVFIYHEPGAPRYVWLALLIGFALLKYLPEGRFKQAAKIYQIIIVLILIMLAIPYAIHSLRVGLYPQLAKPWVSMTAPALKQQAPARSPMIRPQEELSKDKEGKESRTEFTLEEIVVTPERLDTGYGQKQVAQYDPKAMTQTGPGLPNWQPFETIHYAWSGPVDPGQRVSFILIGPKTNLFLAFLRVFLIILLGLGMFGLSYQRKSGFHLSRLKPFFIFPFFMVLLLPPVPCRAADFPSQDMLDELQKRLLEKEDCFPGCASLPQIEINMNPESLTMLLHVDAQMNVVVPLPSHAKQWLPQQVQLDDRPIAGLFRYKERIWANVPAGKHILKLAGKIRKQNILQLTFMLKPRRAVLTINGWSVEGIDPDGNFDSQLQFKRIVKEQGQAKGILETGILPPFAEVRREILLGLVWQVVTTVQRISPLGSAMVLNIPLLPGESLTTEGLRVENGVVQVNMSATRGYVRWQSFLAPAESIILKHAETTDWTEIWTVNVSPIFHMETSGIPVIFHQEGNRWHPTWHPWPEEEVVLQITRPLGVEGQTMTIENSHLELHPGQQSAFSKLSLSIKSSIGGQHIISLPPGATLQEVSIGGKIQPVRQEGQQVPLPITPGLQRIALQWRESWGIKTKFNTSDVNLNIPSVNASTDVYLPKNRWPLLVGGEPLVGPAVLFWSVLCVIVLVAFGLSRTGLTPLKFHHWLLLGLGLSMSHLIACFIIVGWLLALDFRKKADHLENWTFNAIQIGLCMLSVFAIAALVFSISRGLIGHPDMSIVGNGSNSSLLRWYQDVSDGTLPKAWVFSLPLFYYRIAMLAWALWISFYLIKILKWGWEQFASPKIWYSKPSKPKHAENSKENESDPLAT